ncbi:hypothetical protein JAAARDRAFT_200121 [Jaapia argillacea MUCL 33604]|uniref:Protein kinase domain-containing protein n=1 Tax=Jaapia argillacea MUCL 33604 TaxID=933084 RepID=A0A067PGS6_9AGAM|nr:hypothetical protein JAAARDRAFT_200121 [Jaapia argillacea MUCL 33604]
MTLGEISSSVPLAFDRPQASQGPATSTVVRVPLRVTLVFSSTLNSRSAEPVSTPNPFTPSLLRIRQSNLAASELFDRSPLHSFLSVLVAPSIRDQGASPVSGLPTPSLQARTVERVLANLLCLSFVHHGLNLNIGFSGVSNRWLGSDETLDALLRLISVVLLGSTLLLLGLYPRHHPRHWFGALPESLLRFLKGVRTPRIISLFPSLKPIFRWSTIWSRCCPFHSGQCNCNVPTRRRDIPLLLNSVLATSEGVSSIINLENERAQFTVDLIHELLNARTQSTNSQRLFAILQKLCKRSHKFPQDLDIRAVFSSSSKEPDGCGGFSEVYKVSCPTGLVAVKVPQYRADRNPELDLCIEALVSHRLRHPNIVPVFGLSEFKGRLCMVSEWMPNGNLLDFVKKHSDVNRVKLITDLAAGLQYVHSCGLVHGDVKSLNVLIDSAHRARLADFGESSMTHKDLTTTTQLDSRGSPRWWAPELLEPQKWDRQDYNRRWESDVWAFGLTAWEAFAECHPFPEIDAMAILPLLMEITNGNPQKRPSAPGLSNSLWDIILECWRPRWQDRPPMRHILEHLEKAQRL